MFFIYVDNKIILLLTWKGCPNTMSVTNHPGFIKRRAVLYWKHRFLLLLLIPGLLTMIIFQYLPMGGIIIAFKDYKLLDGIAGSEWVGFKHFVSLFGRVDVWNAIRNSFSISLYGFSVGFPATILFALLLNEISFIRFKRICQTITYLPHFLSGVVVSALVVETLSPSTGVINYIITMLGGRPIHFLVEASYFKTIIVMTGVWKGIGWGSIIYLAAIAGANIELYDAALVDGANRFQRIRHVTLPAMYPVITITLIFSISRLMGGDFELIFNMINSQTLQSGDILSTYVFRMGLTNFQYSFSTAVGLFNTLVALTLLIISNKIASIFSEYTIW